MTARQVCNREKAYMNLPTYMKFLRECHGLPLKTTTTIARRVKAALAREVP